MDSPLRIAIVGTGPTGLYTLHALLQHHLHAEVTLYEKGPHAGVGMPYSPETAIPSMLANIASVEIPPLGPTYLDWLGEQPPARLRAFDLDPDNLDERQFTPRLLLGQYFRDALLGMIDRATGSDTAIRVHENTTIVDVTPGAAGLSLLREDGGTDGPFDRVILATGHDFPDTDPSATGYFPSPWSGLVSAQVPATRVGIMGTSLSSIDAAMAVAVQHGRFRRIGEGLVYLPHDHDLAITLMSWTGVLPEADFYCPLPYEPLVHVTDAALADCAAQAGALDAAFALIVRELSEADPAYAARIGLDGLDADSFAAAYFADREAADPFRWARENLAEVEHNKRHCVTVGWRYALLRMHERFERLVPSLSPEDRARFDAGLKLVFVDNYAAVPPESIRRLLALRDAGVLSVLALGHDYTLDTGPDGTVIHAKGQVHHFNVFIDARGQQPMRAADMRLPTLRGALLAAGQDVPHLDEGHALVGVPGYSGRLILAAIPFLMHHRPFVQGITASEETGKAIAAALAADAARAQTLPDRVA